MRKSGILRSFGVFAPQDDVRADIFSTGGRPAGRDAYARDDRKRDLVRFYRAFISSCSISAAGSGFMK